MLVLRIYQRWLEPYQSFQSIHILMDELKTLFLISRKLQVKLMPGHATAIQAVAHLLKTGARLSCYCPVSSQLEQAWIACEQVGLEVEWAGEIIEREWGKASKGGVRPVNGPFGHTAFLLIAQKK